MILPILQIALELLEGTVFQIAGAGLDPICLVLCPIFYSYNNLCAIAGNYIYLYFPKIVDIIIIKSLLRSRQSSMRLQFCQYTTRVLGIAFNNCFRINIPTERKIACNKIQISSILQSLFRRFGVFAVRIIALLVLFTLQRGQIGCCRSSRLSKLASMPHRAHSRHR